MPAVAKDGDKTTCPQHGAGSISAPVRRVEVNGSPVACAGDGIECGSGTTDKILVGSKTVTVNSKPVARVGDALAHGGTIATGSVNVIAGGPAAAG